MLPVTEIVPRDAVALIIDQWLKKSGAKSNSAETPRAYRTAIMAFRAEVQRAGGDLDMADLARCGGDINQSDRAVAVLALAAQNWATAGGVKAATTNLRLAAVSSFYSYAIRMGLLHCVNPIDRVDRRSVNRYEGARPLPLADVADLLARIDRATVEGKRDYAVITLALFTGHRVSALALLRRGNIVARGSAIDIHFPRLKGGKTTYITLSLTGKGAAPAAALMDYLAACDAEAAAEGLVPYDGDAPVWINFSRNRHRGTALTAQGLELICLRWLGTMKFHTLRHTSAALVKATGAGTEAISHHLGHANLAVTAAYLPALDDHTSPFADAIAELIGA